jgi:hypothetical protein
MFIIDILKVLLFTVIGTVTLLVLIAVIVRKKEIRRRAIAQENLSEEMKAIETIYGETPITIPTNNGEAQIYILERSKKVRIADAEYAFGEICSHSMIDEKTAETMTAGITFTDSVSARSEHKIKHDCIMYLNINSLSSPTVKINFGNDVDSAYKADAIFNMLEKQSHD